MTLKVIDVSEWQGVIDWAALKPNIDGAIIRCGYGDDLKSQDDERWERNVTQCERLKIPYGVYLYSYAATDNQAKSEAKHALRLLEGHKPQFPVYIDLEENAQGARARKNADIFCKAIQDAGYIPGVYTFESYFNAYMGGYGKHSLWLAKFNNSKPNVNVEYDAWQYTSDGRIDGYDGRLDVSHFYRDFTKTKSTVTTGTASKVLEVARSQIGVTNGRKYGKWYEQDVDKNAANYNFSASGVPWCAMFASWCFDQAKATCAGLPGAYCPSMLQAGIDAGKAVNPKSAKPGDVVYFDWDGGVVDHVGIVEGNTGSNLVTIEGNTDNGIVARKTRSYSCCVKAVRPDFAASTSKKPTFRVSYDPLGVKWLAAGKCRKGQPMRWLAIKNAGKYRVYTQRNGWLPYVTAYNVKDLESGCAGDGSPILAVEVYSGKYRYAVRKLGGGWFADMIGRTDTSGSADTFAGDKSSKLDGFRISLA